MIEVKILCPLTFYLFREYKTVEEVQDAAHEDFEDDWSDFELNCPQYLWLDTIKSLLAEYKQSAQPILDEITHEECSDIKTYIEKIDLEVLKIEDDIYLEATYTLNKDFNPNEMEMLTEYSAYQFLSFGMLNEYTHKETDSGVFWFEADPAFYHSPTNTFLFSENRLILRDGMPDINGEHNFL